MPTEPSSIELQLPLGQEPISFASVDDVKAWIEEETEFWSWMSELTPQKGKAPQPHQLWQTSAGDWPAVVKVASQYLANPSDALLNKLQQQLSACYTTGVRLTRRDPRAQFAARVAKEEKDVLTAAYILQSFVEPMANPANNAQATAGMIRALLFSHSFSDDNLEAQKRALAEETRQWSDFENTSRTEFATFRSEFTETRSEISTTLEGQRTAFADLLREKGEELDALKETYDKFMALKAPVDYWTKKKVEHAERAKSLRNWFVVALVVAVVAVVWSFVSLLPNLMDGYPALAKGIWPVAIMIAIGTAVSWPVRILARMLLSNLHLQTDAEERETMVQTYLSLLRNEGGLEREHIRIVLESLFRPTSTGIVRDDAAPPGWMSWFNRG